jgi:hypothetical protein
LFGGPGQQHRGKPGSVGGGECEQRGGEGRKLGFRRAGATVGLSIRKFFAFMACVAVPIARHRLDRSPRPVRDLPAGRLRSTQGVTTVAYVKGRGTFAVTEPLGHYASPFPD